MSSLPCGTFGEYFTSLMALYEFKVKDLANQTGLIEETISALRSASGNPRINTILTACIGMDLPFFETERALALAGYTFGASRLHLYYKTLAAFYGGHSIEECNGYLRAKGVKGSDLLGKTKGPKDI